MVQAWQYLWYIYQKFMNFIFNDFVLYNNNGRVVSFGWFIIAIFVFGILFRNLLMLPKKADTISHDTIYDKKGNFVERKWR